ncbi:hypothetical protein [Shewanella vesiculosa]
MDSTTNSLKVHDDNHARAILKGEMRKAREQFIQMLLIRTAKKEN